MSNSQKNKRQKKTRNHPFSTQLKIQAADLKLNWVKQMNYTLNNKKNRLGILSTVFENLQRVKYANIEKSETFFRLCSQAKMGSYYKINEKFRFYIVKFSVTL